MITLEAFPESYRTSVYDLTGEIRNQLRPLRDPALTGHRRRCAQDICKRMMTAHDNFFYLEARRLEETCVDTERVLDWYIQTVGNLFVNYLRGCLSGIEDCGGVLQVPLDRLPSFANDLRITREHLRGYFNEAGELIPADAVGEALIKLTVLRFVERLPFEVMMVVRCLQGAIADGLDQSKTALQPVASFEEHRKKLLTNQFVEYAPSLLCQTVDAFSYLRKRGYL